MKIEISNEIVDKAIKDTIKNSYSNSPELIKQLKKKEFQLLVKMKIEKYIYDNIEEISNNVIEEIDD
jgi:hypothetical protein